MVVLRLPLRLVISLVLPLPLLAVMTFLIGCAVWAFKGWLGDFYPAGSRSSDFLSLYSRRFTTVEGNTTFYSIPDATTVKRWAETTPPGFEFCPKLPKSLTHEGLLVPSLPGALRFLALMQGLGDRLGPLMLQLPPSYGPAQFNDLAQFLQGWPIDQAALAVEVRHLDWFREPHRRRLTELLETLKVGRVLLDTRPIYDAPDHPQLHSERKKPQVPLQPHVTSDVSIIRFISHPTIELNQPYLDEWVALVDRWHQLGKRLYFFVHCPQEERSPANARHFQHLLERHGVDVPPLPWDALDQPPTQLGLF
jgi:uncharacterized protein YecE (DUF72 family)